jgi:ADP-ribose pyrophosphatase YjhB (NUDIX family)
MSYTRCRLGHTHWGRYGAAGLLLVAQGKALLQLRPSGVHEGGTWSVPGGAINHDEDPVDAALREAAEETGLKPATVCITSGWAEDCGGGWTYTTFVGAVQHWIRGPLTPSANFESEQLEWVPLDEVAALPLHPGFRRSWPALRDLARDATNANIDRVTDRIWTGGDRGSQTMYGYLAQLESVGITHVIDCRPEGTRDQTYARTHAPHIGYLLNGQPDNGQKMPDSWFANGVDFALQALTDPDAQVLAHCHMGIARGPSMALAILLATGMTPQDALTAITDARPIAQVTYVQDAIDWWARKATDATT